MCWGHPHTNYSTTLRGLFCGCVVEIIYRHLPITRQGASLVAEHASSASVVCGTFHGAAGEQPTLVIEELDARDAAGGAN